MNRKTVNVVVWATAAVAYLTVAAALWGEYATRVGAEHAEQRRARMCAPIELPEGRKLVSVAWRGELSPEMWLLTRGMREGDRAEAYEFGSPDSSDPMYCKVVIRETAPSRPW